MGLNSELLFTTSELVPVPRGLRPIKNPALILVWPSVELTLPVAPAPGSALSNKTTLAVPTEADCFSDVNPAGVVQLVDVVYSAAANMSCSLLLVVVMLVAVSVVLEALRLPLLVSIPETLRYVATINLAVLFVPVRVHV